jgi:hypothetical protein
MTEVTHPGDTNTNGVLFVIGNFILYIRDNALNQKL